MPKVLQILLISLFAICANALAQEPIPKSEIISPKLRFLPYTQNTEKPKGVDLFSGQRINTYSRFDLKSEEEVLARHRFGEVTVLNEGAFSFDPRTYERYGKIRFNWKCPRCPSWVLWSPIVRLRTETVGARVVFDLNKFKK